MYTDTAYRLRRALLEDAFREAAALVGADIEAQKAEEARGARRRHRVRTNFGATLDSEARGGG